ncbi:hypothetical protein AVEN_264484-1 [Araneus ventricosus]|uniref:Uncharacterized protein n=1 Tax=Araneus ventricosus TaxID=182803 RepID=A0A4Y2M159_ARAVE|nr:hypothetical protein AVEN_264484-1 [Araneus ventricosus]
MKDSSDEASEMRVSERNVNKQFEIHKPSCNPGTPHGGTASSRVRSHRISKRVLASPGALGPSTSNGRAVAVISIRTPASVLELLQRLSFNARECLRRTGVTLLRLQSVDISFPRSFKIRRISILGKYKKDTYCSFRNNEPGTFGRSYYGKGWQAVS